MTRAHSDARPPRWAEATLRVLLHPKDRDSVSGDLLEEYRETIVPTLGSAADRWYVRQVASFLLRASWMWGAILGAALVIRYVFDTRVPTTDYVVRATVLTYTIFGACLLAGFSTTSRERPLVAGFLISISAATIGAVISIVGTAVMLAMWHDPATFDAWSSTGGLAEAFIDVPLDLVVIGAALGLGGAACGKALAVVTRPLRPQ